MLPVDVKFLGSKLGLILPRRRRVICNIVKMSLVDLVFQDGALLETSCCWSVGKVVEGRAVEE